MALLYHTSSASGAIEILAQNMIKAATFVSFSEIPLVGHVDIGANDASIGFHPYAFWGQIEQVIYSEQWFNEHSEMATYIAGEGWSEQWMAPEDDDPDDDEAYETAYLDAELTAFLDKADEREWITKEPHTPMFFKPEDVVVLIVKDNVAEWQTELAEIGYEHVRVVQK